MAVELDTGNPDLRMRWDNTVRYNLGMRMEGQDRRLLNNPNYDESDSKFGKERRHQPGRLAERTRSELPRPVRCPGVNKFAAWYDNAYDDRRYTAPGGALTSYRNSEYNSTVKALRQWSVRRAARRLRLGQHGHRCRAAERQGRQRHQHLG